MTGYFWTFLCVVMFEIDNLGLLAISLYAFLGVICL